MFVLLLHGPAPLFFFLSLFFFFNDTATTEIYTLSLHDALPISPSAKVFHSLLSWQSGPWNASLISADLHFCSFWPPSSPQPPGGLNIMAPLNPWLWSLLASRLDLR